MESETFIATPSYFIVILFYFCFDISEVSLLLLRENRKFLTFISNVFSRYRWFPVTSSRESHQRSLL